jgi:hypothetical protein
MTTLTLFCIFEPKLPRNLTRSSRTCETGLSNTRRKHCQVPRKPQSGDKVRVKAGKETEEYIIPAFEVKTTLMPLRFISDSENNTYHEPAGEMTVTDTEILDFTIARKLIQTAGGKLEINNTTQYTLFSFEMRFRRSGKLIPEPGPTKAKCRPLRFL